MPKILPLYFPAGTMKILSFKIGIMKESLKKILEGLSDEHLALLIAGKVDALPISEEEKVLLRRDMDSAEIIATELLARRKGFVVEETELLKLKKEGTLLGHVPLYELGGLYFIIYDNRVIKVNLAPSKESEKPRKKIVKGGVKLP